MQRRLRRRPRDHRLGWMNQEEAVMGKEEEEEEEEGAEDQLEKGATIVLRCSLPLFPHSSSRSCPSITRRR